MVSLEAWIKGLLEQVSNRVSYSYPADWSRLPCLSFRESQNRVLSQAGELVLNEVIYTVDLWSEWAGNNAATASQVDQVLRGAGLTRIFSEDLYEGASRLHHRVLRYRLVADESGRVYR